MGNGKTQKNSENSQSWPKHFHWMAEKVRKGMKNQQDLIEFTLDLVWKHQKLAQISGLIWPGMAAERIEIDDEGEKRWKIEKNSRKLLQLFFHLIHQKSSSLDSTPTIAVTHQHSKRKWIFFRHFRRGAD
jgi:hypothetical protein